ncbi:glycosyltransferase [Phormidium tenue]|uniref:Glycosyl transferase n=1 Tax=Phormidium tenue NIES-30 TaxID=549789 RepID=A0A1U7J1J6_9CYAN|nr:glycosyltransferase [Phormidium tenue]MBD2232259.1 glycosyltransferase [Phormidium tenue FACHB-1052]OKH45807.1 glycosyl transferase [Phormidium tenue NIES-30]
MTPYIFSIVIPTYNRPERLTSCLQSLTRLDYPRDRFEVIVVDDGNAQPLAPTVKPFEAHLNLTLLRQVNSGPAQARNAGAARAQGQYLVFTDDDCQPHPGWLNAMAAQLKHQPRALVGGHTINALPDNLFSTASQLLIDYLYDYYNSRQAPSFFASNNFAMATEQFRQVGGFDTSFPLAAGEDREFCDRWLQQGLPMAYAPEARVDHSHYLSLRRFWRQHFNYGRGAYCFHQVRARRAAAQVKVEPLEFYWRLLTYPLAGQPQIQGMLLSGLLFLSQVANVVGFFWERTQQKLPPASAPAASC